MTGPIQNLQLAEPLEPLLPLHDPPLESPPDLLEMMRRRAARLHLSLPRARPVLLSLIAFATLFSVLLLSSHERAATSHFPGEETNSPYSECPEVYPPPPPPPPKPVEEEPSYLVGSPTQGFRENLRNDTRYITSWYHAGWTNDVITLGNLIYLAILTDRVPIIPPFTPSHVNKTAGPIPVSEVFDLARLAKTLGRPMLEWQDVKDTASTQVDDLGCWSVWDGVTSHGPREGDALAAMHLDVSWTRVPDFVRVGTDDHALFSPLASLGFPALRSQSLPSLPPPRPSRQHQAVLYPDEHLLCYDFLYFVTSFRVYEMEYDYSPVWRDVLRHLRWSTQLEALADEYIRRSLNVAEGSDTPPYIGIHFRRGDFLNYCPEHSENGCFAPLTTFSERVAEIQQKLFEQKGIRVSHVIMTSDEKDPSWWDEVTAMGWSRVDHVGEGTAEKYGLWYPVLIDAVIQSSGLGFVGTDKSTMTLIAQRRVEDWHGGIASVVRWILSTS
ncbi:hypothetical protein JAAARDRAFT_29286 [Jaapia argillacea MUCL 33604]|uniref:GDP-fucose protein O-fucosyltransferase 2 n=1 Tax=Jaapia argillacea MUCL 33604 TaxID=933084 RepID=A0A067QIB4_9AGAM|nr:hypothetical protein JAAARDRAFT_29286 [Jaapia argillacea MUCL 33604]